MGSKKGLRAAYVFVRRATKRYREEAQLREPGYHHRKAKRQSKATYKEPENDSLGKTFSKEDTSE